MNEIDSRTEKKNTQKKQKGSYLKKQQNLQNSSYTDERGIKREKTQIT